MEFYDIQEAVYEEYKKNGYLEMWDKVEPKIMGSLGEMGLVTTEVAEGLEAIRDEDYLELADECADIIIRVLNFGSRHGFDLETIILAKHEKNMHRGKNHGRKI